MVNRYLCMRGLQLTLMWAEAYGDFLNAFLVVMYSKERGYVPTFVVVGIEGWPGG